MNIRKIRKSMLLSQEGLARKLGISFCSVNRWENGHFKPSKWMRFKLNQLANKVHRCPCCGEKIRKRK